MDRQRKEGGQAWSDHCLHPDRTTHHPRCTRAQRFHSERVPLARGRQTAESSRCVHTKQLFVILSCSHQTWESVEIFDGRIGELTKVQSDWREGLRDLAQSRTSKLNEALDESQAFCSETMSLAARERTARKPVLCSACRARSVTAERRREIGRTTSGVRSREHCNQSTDNVSSRQTAPAEQSQQSSPDTPQRPRIRGRISLFGVKQTSS